MAQEISERVGDSLSQDKVFDVSLVAKAFVLFALLNLVIYLVLRYLAVTTYADDMWMERTIFGRGVVEGVFAVTCIFLFFGLVAYLIHLQFLKLAMIAEDVLGGDLALEDADSETLIFVPENED